MTPEAVVAESGERKTKRAAPEPQRPMREEDLLELVWIADPQISPDGTRIAFTRVEVDREEDEYRTSLWVVGADAGEPRPLTTGPRDAQPRWSPDGSRLAFVRAAEKEKPPQIHVLPMDGGEATTLTSLPKGAGSPVWSPDGRRIAFTSETNPAKDDPDAKKPKREPARVVTRPVFRENNVGFHDFEHRSHLWVVEAAGGTPRQLTHGDFVEGQPRWSRDGRWILFVSDRREEPWFGADESRLYAVSPDLPEPTDGAKLELVADYPGWVVQFTEAPDGRMATISTLLSGELKSYDQPCAVLLSGAWPMRNPKPAHTARTRAYGEGVMSDQHPPRGGGEVSPMFSADGKRLYALAAHEGSALLMEIDLATGAERELTPRGRDLIAGTSTSDGRRWALVIGSPERPGDLYLLDAGTGALTRRFAPNEALLGSIALGTVEEIRYPSFDGTMIHGWIVRPKDYDPAQQHPMVLQIHGGPHGAYGAGFFHEFHVLAGAGYVVLYTNPRGSTSYGGEFANVIQFRYPGDDANDLMRGVDVVLERGGVDPKRIGVTGGSGGGLLTNWLITRTDRFAAACTQRCVTDWGSMVYSSDFALFAPIWFRKQPFEDPKEYADRSPVTDLERITTPLMIIHSEEDWRTPIAQGEILFRGLKYLRRPVVMVRFPGENHELSRSGMPSRRVQNQQHIRRWFDHWLQGKRVEEYRV